MQYREGQTATHRDGRRIVFLDGAWRLAAPAARQSNEAEDRRAQQRMGIPVMPANEDPLRHISDPRRRDITRGSLTTQGAQELARNRPAVDMARSNLAALAEFDQLNDRIRPSGGLVSRALNSFRSALGDDELARMDQISTSMARLMRQPGEGAVSDYEGRLFRQMVGGYDQPYQTNVAYSRAARALARRTLDMHQFREAYLQANGTLIGADTLWERYRSANPLLDRRGNVLNPMDFRTWQSRVRDSRDVRESVQRARQRRQQPAARRSPTIRVISRRPAR